MDDYFKTDGHKYDLGCLLSSNKTFRYQMLDRLRSDCDYYLGFGFRNPKILWAKDEGAQINIMKQLWENFPVNEKPLWLSWEEIEKYERLMLQSGANA